MTHALDHIRVKDVMHHGILSCPADAPLGQVAAMMAEHRVHAVAVTRQQGLRPVGVVSDRDLVAAVASGDEPSALQVAAAEPPAVSAEDSIRRAAQCMAEHGVAHLVVREAASGYPIGILSTLDVAAVVARAADA
ncbi:MAG TPA: CBS domain-containing protein [Solirubrobacteraceae bacterium]|jgi:CBS domain-containing protein